VSDEELRALARAAEESQDAASWLRYAQAAARSGAFDEAGLAAHRARARGPERVADAVSVLDAIAPASLDAFALRELGARFELGKLFFAVFSPDAKTIHAVEGKKAVLAIDAATGARRTIAALLGEATALAADLDGQRLALGVLVPENKKMVNGLATLDLASDAIEPVGRGHKWIHDVALAQGSILAVENDRIRAYRLDAREKSSLSLKGRATVDRTGAFAVALGRELSLHDPLRSEPRVTIGLDVPAENLAVFHFACAGERLVLLVDDVVLLERDGSLRARAQLPATLRVNDIAASPAGRHVAIFYSDGGQRTTRLDLLDVLENKARTFELGARPRVASWSLSGRRLAVPTDQGTVVLIEAASAVKPAPEPPAEKPKDGWIELRSSQRFWRAKRHGALIEFHHGPLGARGTRGATPCLDEDEAKRELERRIAEKLKDGYTRH